MSIYQVVYPHRKKLDVAAFILSAENINRGTVNIINRGDILANLILVGDNLPVMKGKMVYNHMGRDIYKSTSAIQIRQTVISTDAEKAYSVQLLIDITSHAPIERSWPNVANYFPGTPHVIPELTSVKIRTNIAFIERCCVYEIKIVPIKKDSTAYKYHERKELDAKVDITIRGDLHKQADMLNVMRAVFDYPLLNDNDDLAFISIAKPIKGFDCSIPIDANCPLMVMCESTHPNYSHCDVFILKSEV